MKYYWVRIYDYKVDDELKEFTDDNVWDAQKVLFLMNIIFAEMICLVVKQRTK